MYAGPRLVYESYRDHLEPADDVSGVVPGWLAGVHLGAAGFHLAGEGTLAFPPSTRHRGTRYDGGPIFLPTAGMVAYVGSPFSWDR